MVRSGGTMITVLVFLVSCLAVSAAEIVDSEYCEEKCEQGFKCVVTYNGGCFGKPRYGCIREEETCATKKCPENTECKMEEDCPFFSECTEKAICVLKATPEDPCAALECGEGFMCKVDKVMCFVPPCHDIASCVPKTSNSTECATNEEFRACGYACEPSCADDENKPKICTMQCILNVCQCKSGFVRNSKGDCVERMNCDSQLPVEPITCADLKCAEDETCVQPPYKCTGATCDVTNPKCINNDLLHQFEQIFAKTCLDLICPEYHTCVQPAYECSGSECHPQLPKCIPNQLVNHSEFVDKMDPCFGYVCPDGEVCRAEQETICPTLPPCFKSGPKIPKCVIAYDEKIVDQRAFSFGYGPK